MFEIIRKIISGEYCAKSILGDYLLTKQDIKEALASGEEIIVEDGNGNILGYLFLNQDGEIGFIPYTHHTSYLIAF
ncbi:MAG: hypothetical protein OWQ49_06720 [Aquificaceae bacterium]|nr:hypothetical protein [Aquificaceae bacterium]